MWASLEYCNINWKFSLEDYRLKGQDVGKSLDVWASLNMKIVNFIGVHQTIYHLTKHVKDKLFKYLFTVNKNSTWLNSENVFH